MKRTEVRALKIDGEIRKVQVGDSSICAALAAGPSQLQLIGARDGVTRLAVWTASSDGKEQKSVYQVRVGETIADNPNDPIRIANTLTRTARSAFPDSNVTVRPEQGS
jgi:Flp pilus assembly secretin CpaC